LLQTLCSRRAGIDLAEVGIDKLDGRYLPGRLVAADHLQRLVGVDPREAICVRQPPVIDEAVVAGGAFEVDTHENLPDVLGALHLRCLAGIDHPAPDDSARESL